MISDCIYNSFTALEDLTALAALKISVISKHSPSAVGWTLAQRESQFFPSWAFVMPTSLLRVPVSLIESFFWTIVTYWVVGLSAQAGR